LQTLKKRKNFFESEEGKDAKQKLVLMSTDNTYNTVASFTSNSTLYPDNLMSFVDKHMNYLEAHPNLDTGMYLTNLRLKTRVR
jgi:hypothetical protein